MGSEKKINNAPVKKWFLSRIRFSTDLDMDNKFGFCEDKWMPGFQRDWGSFCKDVDSGSTGLGFAGFFKGFGYFVLAGIKLRKE